MKVTCSTSKINQLKAKWRWKVTELCSTQQRATLNISKTSDSTLGLSRLRKRPIIPIG